MTKTATDDALVETAAGRKGISPSVHYVQDEGSDYL